MAKAEGKSRKRSKYTGHLLSETEQGVDYLGESIYADAIAESIHNARTSITIGIYAKWGSGKSFLLKHIESVLRRYQRQDAKDKERQNEETVGYGCFDSWNFLLWVLVLVFVFVVFTISLLLVIDPSLFLPPLSLSSTQSSNVTTTTVQTVLSAEAQRAATQRTMKIVGCVLIPLELVVIFSVASFSLRHSTSPRFGNWQILMYTAFTKIPIPTEQNEIVEDPGQSPAEALRYVKPGNELVARAAACDTDYPRRYIFVNFKAWEYAGSDTLWAAIVTNISDEIEKEFGVITSRLFRTLTVSEVPKKDLERSGKSLYMQFTSGTRQEEIKAAMIRYGAVDSILPLSCPERPARAGFKWYEITYATHGEFRNAKESLRIEGVSILTKHPNEKGNFTRRSPVRESKRPLATGVENIPMNDIDGELSDDESEAEYDPVVKLETLSRLCCCCKSFCSHFIHYPVTLCRFPRLLWWIILLVACILVPVSSYLIANFLNLQTAQTFWRVPVYAQVLLWLPAPIAVTVVVLKFVWALCHSQTQRINQALDGTQGKMASQLGFMSVVKEEIQVMTNLIRIAKFVLQKDYRIVIAIDDLDQVDLKKVHAVLEAVSILLSDKSSPFVCIIAADPRIVVKCVEDSLGSTLQNAKVSGREYLKKIINLPVCLPDINDSRKRRYIAGLIDQSDHTINYRKSHVRHAHELSAGDDAVDGGEGENPENQILSHPEFLFECRKCLYDSKDLQRHIHGNARSMKRIFNVISLTSCLINCIVKRQDVQEFMRRNVNGGWYNAPAVEGVDKIERTRKLARKLVHWIVLAEEWPYRTSFIIQVTEDSDQRDEGGFHEERIPDEWSILDIYINKVQDLLKEETRDKALMSLDSDPDLFQTYLILMTNLGFKKPDIMSLLRLTINLDYSIRRKIGLSLSPKDMPKDLVRNFNQPIVTEENPPRRDGDNGPPSRRSSPRPPKFLLMDEPEIEVENGSRETVC